MSDIDKSKYFFVSASLLLLFILPISQPIAQSGNRQRQDNSIEERRAASDEFWRERNAAFGKFRQERNDAFDKFRQERNAAIDRYQKALSASLRRNYLYEEDTTITKALVSSALRDSIEPGNLANAVKILEDGVKNAVDPNDALDVARLVSQENINVSVEQTAAFSQARQIARENNANIAQSDEMLFNALREELPADELIETAKKIANETLPTQAQPTFSPNAWENKMRSKIQEFFTAKTPYVWGGNSIHSGVDCSGFTTIVLHAIGIKDIKKYRQSGAQFRKFQDNDVKPQNAKFGDLIFFYDHKEMGIIGHVGIVERLDENGNVVFVHSSSRRKGIGRDTMTDASYWGTNFAGIKRVVD